MLSDTDRLEKNGKLTGLDLLATRAEIQKLHDAVLERISDTKRTLADMHYADVNAVCSFAFDDKL